MTEIFLSYDSGDRERARPVRDALAAQGFDVLWEQEAPADVEWEGWVRKRLARCKCVVALQSAASLHSNKTRHVEAVAEEQGKLILVHLEPLSQRPGQNGIGGLNLSGWLAGSRGDLDRPEWRELRRRIEAKLKASLWVQRLIHEVSGERTNWRAQYESSAGRCKSLNEELARERTERGAAQDKVAGLQAQLDEEAKSRTSFEARIVALEQRLAGVKGAHAETQQRLRDELHQRSAKLAEIEAALRGQQAEGERLKSELRGAEGASTELKARLAAMEAAAAQREARIADLEARLSQRGTEVATLTTQVADRDKIVLGLQAGLKQRDTDLAALREKIAQRTAQITNLEAARAERDASIARLSTAAAQRDKDIAGLQGGIAAREASIGELTASAKERDAYIAELESGVVQRDTFITDLTASTEEQNAYIVKLEATLAQRQTYIANLERSMAELERRSQQIAAARALPVASASASAPAKAAAPEFSMFNRVMLTTMGVAGVALSVLKVRQG